MAKSLLLHVLVDVLGNYVEGLTAENLKLGVWSGKIELNNLQLKDSALDQLNLPLKVVKGSLKKLRVKVPWTQLESKPVEVYIEGVYLLAMPLDLSKCTHEESKRMIEATKASRLKQVDDLILFAVRQKENDSTSTAQKASYVQQLTTHIVDNLEVQIRNIHIRYEDPDSDPNHPFSAGLTLDKIVLTTTDDGWNVQYVKRDAAKKATTAVNKLGTLQNCSLYWNTSSPMTCNMRYDEWENFMLRTIHTNETSTANERFEKFMYVLEAPNNLTLKLTHREVCDEHTPNIDILIESSVIKLRAQQTQYQQLMLVLNSFGELDLKKQVSLFRPMKRPKEDPRAWWHYAYRLVTGKDNRFAEKVICIYKLPFIMYKSGIFSYTR